MTKSNAQKSTADLKQQVINDHHKKSKKSSGPAPSKVVSYIGAFLLLVGVVAVGYEPPKPASGQVATVNEGAVDTSRSADNVPSVDEVVATSVAADLAERANLPIAKNAANMSISLSAKSELAQTDTTAISKPQIIQPSSSNRAIKSYKTVKGDSVPSVATKFGISADTVRWANDLTDTDALEPGRKLDILPVSGVLHTVQKGDSVQSIANKFNATPSRIVAFNDLEISGVKKGQRIIVPGGKKAAVASPTTNSGPDINGTATPSTGDISGNVVDTSMASASAGNRYAPGNCTWYAYERRAQLGRPIGSFWGNANTWAMNARSAGYTVNSSPAAGAIFADQAGFYGHVGVVERVKENGDVVVTEMNNYAYGGFNIVNQRTISAGQASAYTYIH